MTEIMSFAWVGCNRQYFIATIEYLEEVLGALI